MDPGRWQRIDALLSAALERQTQERASFVAQACQGDEELREHVERLLRAHQDAGNFLESSPSDAASAIAAARVDSTLSEEANTFVKPTPSSGPAGPEKVDSVRLGRHIGPYRVLDEIGHGGMGAVYRAVRDDDQYQKVVAIKLVRGGFGSDLVIERFKAERQILANLEHPNIARLIDGGATEEGWPYFSMEYVEGEAIDRYCTSRNLSVRERLELFRTACSAVHYAHQRLVIHRDLKPSNILVTADGSPKLLDFGIAKLLDPEAGEAAAATLLPAMTPEYASPEQVKGESITTATDVYSLGILLYELLAQRRAYELKSRSAAEVARVVCGVEPARPSTVAPRVVAKQLSGDLDTIVLKALRKEPARRYASVQELSEDIRRHLEGLPVSARGDGFAYRTGKFVTRHRYGVAALTLIILSLAGGLFETSRQKRRAEQRFNDVRKLAKSFLFDFDDLLKNLPGTTKARELAVRRAQEYLQVLEADARGNTALQAELATAYEVLAAIQDGSDGGLGNVAGALTSWNKALELREAIAAATRSDLNSASSLAQTLRNRAGTRFRLGDPHASNDTRRAVGILEPLVSAHFEPRAARILAATYLSASAEPLRRREFQEGLADRRKAVELWEKLAAAEPKNAELQRDLALGYKYLGATLEVNSQRAMARELYQKAVAIDSARLQAEPANARAKMDLSFSQGSLAYCLYRMGDGAGALEQYRKALALREDVAAADPANAFPRISMARAHLKIAEILRHSEQPEQALAAALKASEIVADHVRANPANANDRDLLAEIYTEIGDCEAVTARAPSTPMKQRLDHWRSARSAYLKSEEIRGALLKEGKLRRPDSDDPKRNEKGLARCDEALAPVTSLPTQAPPSAKQPRF
jgi:serine/threonine protein kinase